MNALSIAQPKTYDEAARVLANEDGSYRLPILKAGGMDIVDHLKEGLMEPDLLVNVRMLRSNGAAQPIRMKDGELHIEASATLAQLAHSDVVRKHAPALAQAAGSAATPQVRNIATAAGNLRQRPRCWYYRQKNFDCLKKGGDRCYAVQGENKYHAVFGGGPCHIVHPSNIAPALMLGDATLHLIGGDRDTLAVAEMYHLPERGVQSEDNLQPGEVITHITMKPVPDSGFYAVKEKQSFDWPLVFAVVAFDRDGSTARNARVIAGAVAPVPWPLERVAKALEGKNPNDENAIEQACSDAARGAEPMSDNAYKLKLLPVTIRRAVQQAAADNKQW